jgi:phosphoribosylformylglycinamidine (FGAM) synthase-like amidotransferase family enzyme
MVVTLVVIAAFGVLRGGVLFSPGKLSTQAKAGVTLGGVQSHADLSGKCAACHPSPLSRDTMDVRCTNCHTNIGRQLTDANTLHGALYASSNNQLTCRACHTEHRGPDAAITAMDPLSFPHEVVGFSLKAHAQMPDGRNFTCADCHGEDITTFDAASCETCHRDLDAVFVQGHTADFGQDCIACHDGVETYGKNFDHNALAFPLEGKHAQTTCASCHEHPRQMADFKGLAACGGFSFGDVMGAGRGWANAILFNERARKAFADFFLRTDTFALGVCNGCQMMSRIKSLIPGAEHWPTFARNRSEQFEARLLQVEVLDSPSILLAGMEGSRLPLVVAHGEGRAAFDSAQQRALSLSCLRYIEPDGRPATRYPFNPNGSPDGVTGFTTPDGRFTIMMPHPERLFRTVQHSWHPKDWGEDGPWLRMFRNARVWLG